MQSKIASANGNETDTDETTKLSSAETYWIHSRSNVVLSGEEIDDEFVHDSETETSFSLEECMNEFRARRNRRVFLHTRQERNYYKEAAINNQTELELINQNLFNKEQERKCKPCKDGFCYCFTSDSGDGAGSCSSVIKPRAGHIPRSKSTNCNQVSESKTKHFKERSSLNGSETETNNKACIRKPLNVVANLETSNEDGPLIHIIHELRDNCIISTVKVNNKKLESSKLFSYNRLNRKIKKADVAPRLTAFRFPEEPREPTAPVWENVDESNILPRKYKLSPQLSNSLPKTFTNAKRRNMAGGRLLQKRLSALNLSYKLPDGQKPPPKPPRSSISFDESSTNLSASTALSVREAERVLDNFLLKKGYTVPLITKDQSLNSLAKETANKNAKISGSGGAVMYPSLDEIANETKRLPHSEKKLTKSAENKSKNYNIGWINPNNSMSKYDITRCAKTETEANKCIETNISHQDDIGWRLFPKKVKDPIDCDVHHNLALNFKNKDTPLKEEISKPRTLKFSSKRVGWTQQFRNLSPWSKDGKKITRADEVESNLRNNNSKHFVKKSSRKILRLISPKKENKDKINTSLSKPSLRNVAIQTADEEINENSPPGSYHSPIESSQLRSWSFDHSITLNSAGNNDDQNFDFSRHVNSPTKKSLQTSQRKLFFPLNCAEYCSLPQTNSEIRTYRSFNRELDKDVSLSKMSYILSNIRTKLEENDLLATQTLLETKKNMEFQLNIGVDSVDGAKKSDVADYYEKKSENLYNDPIYFEVDDKSLHVLEGPVFDNRTGIQRFTVNDDPKVTYAQVNKNTKRSKKENNIPSRSLPLGTILHQSITNDELSFKLQSLSLLEDKLQEKKSLRKQPLKYQSLNNVHSVENHSSPKVQKIISKSDFSLHQSHIFLENLFKSELLLSNPGKFEYVRLQKIENKMLPESQDNNIPSSYLGINDTIEKDTADSTTLYDGEIIRASDESVLGLSTIEAPSCNNQSTPKKTIFTTKQNCKNLKNGVDNSPGKPNFNCLNPLSKSLYRNNSQSISKDNLTLKTPPVLKNMKLIIRKSFRKSKTFFKAEKKRKFPSQNIDDNGKLEESAMNKSDINFGSSFDLDSLFTVNQSIPIDEQLNKVVHVCRKLPDFESSAEMVEAERLLLYSKLLRQTQKSYCSNPSNEKVRPKPVMTFFVDDMSVQLRPDAKHDMFYNYFYVVTFDCNGIIRSTQTVEHENAFIIFRDCNIEFSIHTDDETINNDIDMVNCKVFLLRLRKISTLSLEPTKQQNVNKRCSLSSVSSSSDEIVSRFRLYASFTLNSSCFIPYEYVEQDLNNSNTICITSSKTCYIPLKAHTKTPNVNFQMQLKGRAKLSLPKRCHKGFLNVADPFIHHNWNRRWCSVEGFIFNVWDDENNINKLPLLTLNLQSCESHTLYPAARNLCARPRSFRLKGTFQFINCEKRANEVYFAAETEKELKDWLETFNYAFDIIRCWLRSS